MDVLRDMLMMCSLCMVFVSSTLDVLFSRKPYGIRMCSDITSKYREKIQVSFKYDELKLECVIIEHPSKITESRKMVALTSHGKQNVLVPTGTRRKSKGIARQTQEMRKAGMQKVQPSTSSNKMVSNMVLSIAGSSAYNRRLYILLFDPHAENSSCIIKVFRFFNESYMKSVQKNSFRFKCHITEKKVYQICMVDRITKTDKLGLVISGDVFELLLYGDPVQSNLRAFSAPLQWNKVKGPTICFFCGEIVCLQKNFLLRLDLYKDRSSSQSINHHHKFTDMTDVAYSAKGNHLIIVCKEQLLLAKFYPSEDKIVVKDTIQTAMLTVTWLQSGLVFHPNGRLGNFKTCVSFSECNLLD